jgi:hypothetical protein
MPGFVQVLETERCSYSSATPTGLPIYKSLKVLIGGRDSVVGIPTNRGSKPAEGVVREFVFSEPVQTGRGIHPAYSTMDTGAPFQGQSGRGVALTSDPHVVTRLRMSRAEPVSPLARYGAPFTCTCHCGQHRVNTNVTSIPPSAIGSQNLSPRSGDH